MSISPTCLLPVERNDEELRNGRVCTSLRSCEIMSSIFWTAANEWAGYSELRCICRLHRWREINKKKKQTKWRRIQEQKRSKPTQQFASLHLVAIMNSVLFFPYTWTDVRNRTHVEFWIPANGYNTATAQNWPHPDVFASFNCLHSTLIQRLYFIYSCFLLISTSSFTFLLLSSFLHSTDSSFLSFFPSPSPNRCPPNDPHPPTHQFCLFFSFWCLIFKPHVFSRCSLQSVKYYFKAEKIWTRLQNTYTTWENAGLPFRRIHCSLNATAAQSKNCPFRVNTTI